MDTILELTSSLLLYAGAAFCVLGGVGLLRLPDVYSRMHASGLVDTGGATLILVGLMLVPAHWTVVVKLGGILFFLYVTTSTATHALAHAAYTSGVEPLQAEGSAEASAP